ncbi:MAG: 3-deoxy-manno-octulosonate cytidylyltransferase [Gammaproteobacteria bacterium]|nr:MAG: 3-deoxy-manno-octulosonate cytidylyltransferase [Gammaproteobacteria bacterium]
MTPSYSIVIPARYGSSRFPGKPLFKLAGRELLLHVVDRARESGAEDIVVATDDERIAARCKAEDVDVQMTAASHPSGTDRIAEVADARGWEGSRLIVGLQGDEPMTEPAHLDQLAANLAAHAEAQMATLSVPVASMEDYRNPNRVKVVTDSRGLALYFSRSPIPFVRDRQDDDTTAILAHARIHLGIYAYRRRFLEVYRSLTATELESLEQLEQLRVLCHGYRIHVGEIAAAAPAGVDHPDDVASVEKALRLRPAGKDQA